MKVKELYEKMVDYKQYGTVLLAVSAFLYLGVIIPSEGSIVTDSYIMMAATLVLLSGSIFFFSTSKRYRKALMEMDEGQDYLMKK